VLYYRYRPSGELALKELRYNEIYFSSTIESNDPYDGKVFLSYKFDMDKWKRLLDAAWKGGSHNKTMSALAISLSTHLDKNCPATFEEAVSYDYRSVLLEIDKNLNPLIAYQLDILIKQFLNLYRPGGGYTVSFSKKNNNTLMWSHYASKHKGFCLIFKAIDGFLYQDKEHLKRSVDRKTPKGLAPSSSFGLPERFHFQDILYCSTIEMLDASRFMPWHVFGRDVVNDEERIKFVIENESKSLEKHECWHYEEESRLTLNEPTAWLFGDHYDYSQEERLLHYQPTQLVGIILGAMMDQKVKERIHEIIIGFREKIMRDLKEGTLFDFVLFEASISDKHRDVEITPKAIYNSSKAIYKDDPHFISDLKKWEEGWALVFHGKGGASKKQFPPTN
jgi:hypothetical protein